MKKILVTGYKPFLDFPFNPTEVVANKLNGIKFFENDLARKPRLFTTNELDPTLVAAPARIN